MPGHVRVHIIFAYDVLEERDRDMHQLVSLRSVREDAKADMHLDLLGLQDLRHRVKS